MAELTKAQLKAAADRAGELSLAEEDVALQTSDTMPERLKIKGSELETAGTEVHGAVYSFTRKDVETALERWGSQSGRGSQSGQGRGRGTGNGRRRRQAASTEAEPKADATPAPPASARSSDASTGETGQAG
jgi:hypothetical protein